MTRSPSTPSKAKWKRSGEAENYTYQWRNWRICRESSHWVIFSDGKRLRRSPNLLDAKSRCEFLQSEMDKQEAGHAE